ncbi:hypothetical protein YC2023_040062 [Brassica napus]
MACLIKLLGDRGVVDLGIGDAKTVAEVSERHRRRRHRVAVLTEIEDEIKRVKSRALQGEPDISLRKKHGHKCKGQILLKRQLEPNQISVSNNPWFAMQLLSSPSYNGW